MRSTLDELTTELTELKALVASIAPVNDALSKHENSLVQRYVSIRRRFDYAAFAVVLYASFEKFVENLAAAYVQLESRRVQYTALPQKLIDKHLKGTAELLWRKRIGQGRYAGLSELGTVKNLFECLSGVTPYALNEPVIIAHEANLRAGEVDVIFGAIGVEGVCDNVRKADALMDWYRTAAGLGLPSPEGIEKTVIEERLKDIVERRNQVAHRGGNPDNLLGVDAMNEAIGFIEALSQSIFALVVGRYLESHHSASAQRVELAQRQDDGPYQNGTIVIIEEPAHRIFVGQPVFVITDSRCARWGRIQSLKIDDGDVQVVEPSAVAPQGVGVGLDFRCPKGAMLIALSEDDDVEWSPRLVAAASTV